MVSQGLVKNTSRFALRCPNIVCKNIQWCHNYKMLKCSLEIQSLTGNILNCNSTTIPSVSQYEGRVINMSCECQHWLGSALIYA